MRNANFSLRKAVLELLNSNSGKEYTAREIAQVLADKYPDAVEAKIKASSNKNMNTKEDCIAQWSAEIPVCKDYFERNNVFLSSDRPRTYSIKSSNNSNNSPKGIVKDSDELSDYKDNCRNNQPEKELYPKLAEYCKSLKIMTLRIDEKNLQRKEPTIINGFMLIL